MFPNEAQNSIHQPDLSSSDQNTTDPWQNPSSPRQETTSVPETWNLIPETTPLISSGGIPGVPKLTSHQSTSEEILLEDELKLKTTPGNLLKEQLEKALALLFWNK